MSAQGFKSEHFSDENGNPAGGTTYGVGFTIGWQRGPLVVNGVCKSPNGAYVEDVLAAVIDRIEHYQETQFKSAYNGSALVALRTAMSCLQNRTADRANRGVEGTHEV